MNSSALSLGRNSSRVDDFTLSWLSNTREKVSLEIPQCPMGMPDMIPRYDSRAFFAAWIFLTIYFPFSEDFVFF